MTIAMNKMIMIFLATVAMILVTIAMNKINKIFLAMILGMMTIILMKISINKITMIILANMVMIMMTRMIMTFLAVDIQFLVIRMTYYFLFEVDRIFSDIMVI